MPQVFMPRLSDTMTEGTVSTWTKGVGERIEKGDVIAEIETDKATMELEAYDAGILEQILVQVGTTVPIGEVIAVIGDGSGATAAASGAAPTKAATPAAAPAAAAASAEPAAAPAADAAAAAPATDAATAPAATAAPAPVPAAPQTPPSTNGSADVRLKASPLARAIARDAGLDLASVQGSGPGGRIVRADVQQAVSALASGRGGAANGASSSPSATSVVAGAGDESVPLNNVRRITAKRLTESMQQAPHFYVTSIVAADELVAARARINQGLAAVAAPDTTAPKISINDLVVKAVAAALRAHPAVNVSFGGDVLIKHGRVHIGVAVALPDGLIVPVLRDADTLTVTQISARGGDSCCRRDPARASRTRRPGGGGSHHGHHVVGRPPRPRRRDRR